MFLGLDLGTGSVKALLVSAAGEPLGSASFPYAVHSPHPGWAESGPEEWWVAAARATREAVKNRAGEVEAVGLSGQMHGVVLSGADGTPARPAVLWADVRAAGQIEAYRALDARFLRRLANPPAVGMAGPTLLWLKKHESEIYASVQWALQPKDWLRLRLTGEAKSEPSDASATLLYDLEEDRWYSELLKKLGLNSRLLAPLTASAGVAGSLTREAAEAFGLSEGTPVAAGAGDTAAAILGTGLAGAGTVQITVGTGAQVVALRPSFSPDETGRTHLFRSAAAPEPFYAMAALQNAGLALEWVRKVLRASWTEVYEEAFSVPPGAEGVTFVPNLGGERTPRFDPGSRGAWIGLGLGHTRGHLLRAALEGVAFSIREGLEALEEATAPARSVRLAGGGTTDGRWRRLLAGALGRALLPLPEDLASSASARGAALLAARAAKGGFEVDATPASPAVEPEDREAYEEAYQRYLNARPSG